MELVERTRTAAADAWQAEGLLRESLGGGAAEFRDVRVMASGLPHQQWNNADVSGPNPDLDAARAFYSHRGLPWGVRLEAGSPGDPGLAPAGRSPGDPGLAPAGRSPFGHGRHVARLALMALLPRGFHPARAAPELDFVLAGTDDLETVVAIDAAAFGEDPQASRLWIEPHLGARGVETAIATLDGRPVATAYTLRTDGRAGPALYLGGVAVVEAARRRGVAAALASWLLERRVGAGAQLAHLHADTEASARVFARLGFQEAGALDVYAEP